MGEGGRRGDRARLGERARRGFGRRARWRVVVAVAVTGTAVLLAACSTDPLGAIAPTTRSAASGSTASTTATASTPATGTSSNAPAPTGSGPACPLTGMPAPGGAVPDRSALAVKVTNYPTGRPQSGLTKATVVFEEPVEGGITRFAAVYQCQGTSSVGPVRSARNIDIGILGQLGSPIFVHVGGIQPVIDNILASPLDDFELGDYTTSVVQHPPGRIAPYDTYTDTTTIWAMRSTAHAPPQPLFTYSSTTPAGTPAESVSIPFSHYSPVVWNYDAKTHRYLRYYGPNRDMLADGVQDSAANVIVQFVNVYYGPWVENTEGGLEVQANLYTNASGQAMIFRNGVQIPAQWSRSSLTQATQFTTTSGAPVTLQPGNTWVELVPTTVQVSTK